MGADDWRESDGRLRLRQSRNQADDASGTSRIRVCPKQLIAKGVGVIKSDEIGCDPGDALTIRSRTYAPLQRGAIVNIASLSGLVGLRHSGAYTAAKHGVVGTTQTAALDCPESQIKCRGPRLHQDTPDIGCWGDAAQRTGRSTIGHP